MKKTLNIPGRIMDTNLAELRDTTGTDEPFWGPRRQLLTLHGTLTVTVDTVSGQSHVCVGLQVCSCVCRGLDTSAVVTPEDILACVGGDKLCGSLTTAFISHLSGHS